MEKTALYNNRTDDVIIIEKNTRDRDNYEALNICGVTCILYIYGRDVFYV